MAKTSTVTSITKAAAKNELKRRKDNRKAKRPNSTKTYSAVAAKVVNKGEENEKVLVTFEQAYNASLMHNVDLHALAGDKAVSLKAVQSTTPKVTTATKATTPKKAPKAPEADLVEYVDGNGTKVTGKALGERGVILLMVGGILTGKLGSKSGKPVIERPENWDEIDPETGESPQTQYRALCAQLTEAPATV